MQRGLIRKRFQVTIPRWVRRTLNLFEGQTLNWDVLEEGGAWFIKIYSGSFSLSHEEAAFKEYLRVSPKKERKSRALKFGISDTFIAPRGRDKLRAIIMEVLGDLGVLQGGLVLKGGDTKPSRENGK